MNWEAGGFGSVMIASFTIVNPLSFAVKDVGVQCEVYGESGTRLGIRDEKVFRVVKSRSKERISKLNMGFVNGQSARANCSIVSAVKG